MQILSTKMLQKVTSSYIYLEYIAGVTRSHCGLLRGEEFVLIKTPQEEEKVLGFFFMILGVPFYTKMVL